MANDKLRKQIAWQAALFLFGRQEFDIYRAKLRAARRICRTWVRPEDLPEDAEIRRQVEALSRGNPGPEWNEIDSRDGLDRFCRYRQLLMPLEQVRQPSGRHPEGDALFHSLQVFELARSEISYDEEFLLAALLHDVGKAIDLHDHVAAGLDALGDSISVRTAWLIENHPHAHALTAGTLGARARRRLHASDDFEELMLLSQCDRNGRLPGGLAPDIDEALGYLRALDLEHDA